MGFTTIGVKLINPESPRLTCDARLLIDTGALYSIVPAHLLEAIKLKRKRSQKFTLANGKSITRWVSDVLFTYGDYEGAAPVIFGEQTDKPLLGVVTLEALGLEIDPISHELRPAPLLLLSLGKNEIILRYC